MPANPKLKPQIELVFYKSLLEVMLGLDFDRITKAMIATGFGNTEPTALPCDVKDAAIHTARQVARRALFEAVERGQGRTIGCGGFYADVEPDGQVMRLTFVIDEWDTHGDDFTNSEDGC
jgi:hypothetical protein